MWKQILILKNRKVVTSKQSFSKCELEAAKTHLQARLGFQVDSTELEILGNPWRALQSIALQGDTNFLQLYVYTFHITLSIPLPIYWRKKA